MMKTTIIPQIKQITAFDTPLALSSFSLSQSVLDNFPRAKEIFADNRIGGENPIRYVVEHVYSGKESMEKVLTAVSEEAAKQNVKEKLENQKKVG